MVSVKCLENYAVVKMGTDGTFEALASTDAVDRDGEVVMPGAFKEDLDAYRDNPVILASHTHRSQDGRPTVIGSAVKIDVTDAGLAFEGRFAGTPLASEYRQLYEEGHMRGFSIGFIPMAGEMREVKWGPGCRRRRRRDVDEPSETKVVYVHTRVELLEISCVAVPANPEAVMRDFDPARIERLIDERIQEAIKTIETKLWLRKLSDLLAPFSQASGSAMNKE